MIILKHNTIRDMLINSEICRNCFEADEDH